MESYVIRRCTLVPPAGRPANFSFWVRFRAGRVLQTKGEAERLIYRSGASAEWGGGRCFLLAQGSGRWSCDRWGYLEVVIFVRKRRGHCCCDNCNGNFRKEVCQKVGARSRAKITFCAVFAKIRIWKLVLPVLH